LLKWENNAIRYSYIIRGEDEVVWCLVEKIKRGMKINQWAIRVNWVVENSTAAIPWLGTHGLPLSSLNQCHISKFAELDPMLLLKLPPI
jgi:hypothetical protein